VRVTFRAGYAVGNPITRREMGATGSAYPFAILQDATP